MKALTQEQLGFFRENGFLFPIPALTATEAKACLDGLARLEAELGCHVADADPKWRSHAHFHSPWFNDLVRHPKILDAIEDVIGPDILVWTSTFFIKEAGSATYAAWHQDGGYFGLEPKISVCAWTALTDATREAGCMEQLSFHGQPKLCQHSPKGLPNSINRAGQTIVEPFDETSPTAMALPAGSFSLHHADARQRDAGAWRGPLWSLRSGAADGRRARRRFAGATPGGQRPLPGELPRAGGAPPSKVCRRG